MNINFNDYLSIINSVSQAFATIFAVILAFMLSIFSERSSWNQRKKEQIREHQIDSVKTLVHIMQQIDFLFLLIIEIKNQISKEIQNSELSNTQKTNRISSGNSQINENLIKLNSLKIEFLKELYELKFLKFEDSKIKIIEDYINMFQLLMVDFKANSSFVENKEIKPQKIININKIFIQFINEAEHGLTK